MTDVQAPRPVKLSVRSWAIVVAAWLTLTLVAGVVIVALNLGYGVAVGLGLLQWLIVRSLVRDLRAMHRNRGG